MSDPAAAEKKAYKGSCHCGAITYTANLSLGPSPVATRCNCTICLKSGFTSVSLPRADFVLHTPSSISEVPDYQWGRKLGHRHFCRTCGVQVFGYGAYEIEGKTVEFFVVNVLTLEQPQEGLQLEKFVIKYFDGKNDNWFSGPMDAPVGQCI